MLIPFITQVSSPRPSVVNSPPTVEELLALERMRKKRLCPNARKLIAGGAAVIRHLEFCDECRERMDFLLRRNGSSSWLPNLAGHTIVLPEISQVRDIKHASIGIVDTSCDEYLFNPPLVLVVQVPETDSQFVRVAQIHDEPELAGLGDVEIELPDGVRFVESWNTYPILVKYLGPVLGNVPKYVVRLVLQTEKKGLPDVPEDSPIEAFRELETKIAYNFCHQSVSEIMRAVEQEETCQKEIRAKLHTFVPPKYDGINDEWNKPEKTLFPFLAVGSIALPLQMNFGKNISDIDHIKKYYSDVLKFEESAKKMYDDYLMGNILLNKSIDETIVLLINAEKAANSVLFLVANLIEKANNGDVKTKIVIFAKECAEKAQLEVKKIHNYLDTLKKNS